MEAKNKPGEPEKKNKDGGPAEWYTRFIEKRYIHLKPRPSPEEHKKKVLENSKLAAAAKQEMIKERLAEKSGKRPPAKKNDKTYKSHLLPGRGEEIFAPVAKTYWHDIMNQYRQKQSHARTVKRHIGGSGIGSPGMLGQTNWIPIGPMGVAKAQPTGRPVISGRSPGIAIANDGMTVYMIGADGGVWKSGDAGNTWTFMMANFDQDPAYTDATSLACGAIAININSPNRVYVGTGEGDTDSFFASRLTNSLPSYRGIGPVVSIDGGSHWSIESADAGSPTLDGAAFYALAVDPNDQDNVVGATSNGLYRRESNGMGGYHWVQKSLNGTPDAVVTSVVVASSGGTTTFFAATWADQVYSSNDGSTWTQAGTGFPTGITRIGLAVQSTNPNVLYALNADGSDSLQSICRLDNGSGTWRTISGTPPDFLQGQGNYDLTIEVDQNNPDIIYMGGSFDPTGPDYDDAGIFKATITSAGSGASLTYSMAPTYVGISVHPDVHCLKFSPGSSDDLWVCCDGGIFKSTNASTAATFSSCNVGLGTLSTDYIGQHPTQPAVMFIGLQDNGTARYTGEEIWQSVGEGDGGHCIINWSNPYEVIHFQDGGMYLATDGGQDYPSWTPIGPTGGAGEFVYTWETFLGSFATTPYNPGSPPDANIVAVPGDLYDSTTFALLGSYIYISSDFGTSWPANVEVPSSDTIYCLAFASATILYAGSTSGAVYKIVQSGGTWTLTQIDTVAAGPLTHDGIVTAIGIDYADATGNSIYITYGGTGDYRHVWHFDGTSWTQKSGPSAGALTSLLDVETSAIVVDPLHTSTIYVGADIGVWKSTDGGSSWAVMENGLPDAAVLDLQIQNQTPRLLRAAMHGMGVYQYKLDAPAAADVELYIRDTALDLGLTNTIDGIDDPTQVPTSLVYHWESPNIKVDVPTPAGYQTPGTSLNFYQFNYEIVDGSQNVGTIDPASGTVVNRVYLEVHNRGIKAANLQVTLLLADASPGLPALPSGYTSGITGGTGVSMPPTWQTVGVKPVSNLTVGLPQVIEFDLPSTLLPPPASLPGNAHYCLLAFLHSASDDPFTSTETDVNTLTIDDRKVAQKNLHIVQFIGTPPAGGGGDSRKGMWSQISLHGNLKREIETNLEFDLTDYPSTIGLLFPQNLIHERLLKGHKTGEKTIVKKWAEEQRSNLEKFIREGRFNHSSCKQMLNRILRVTEQEMILLKGGKKNVIEGLQIAPGSSHQAFLYYEFPAKAKVGQSFQFRLIQTETKTRRILGGNTYRVEVLK